MALILNIDTATEIAFVNIAKDGRMLHELIHDKQRDHAAFVQPAIASLIKQAGVDLHELDAVAVTEGPGSYTGLRVGMASAKGICYALDKKLIAISSLELLASSAISVAGDATALYCAMIDARRMEVFTAIYTNTLAEVISPAACVLEENSYNEILINYKIFFTGSGTIEWGSICTHNNANFISLQSLSAHMSELSFIKFNTHHFADLNYAEPLYIKGFSVHAKKFS